MKWIKFHRVYLSIILVSFQWMKFTHATSTVVYWVHWSNALFKINETYTASHTGINPLEPPLFRIILSPVKWKSRQTDRQLGSRLSNALYQTPSALHWRPVLVLIWQKACTGSSHAWLNAHGPAGSQWWLSITLASISTASPHANYWRKCAGGYTENRWEEIL